MQSREYINIRMYIRYIIHDTISVKENVFEK